MKPVTVELTTPVKDFGKQISTVTIGREAIGTDLLAIEGQGDKTATLTMISRLCGLSWDTVKTLTFRDIKAIEVAMSPFAGIGPQTGEPSSESSPSDTDGQGETS